MSEQVGDINFPPGSGDPVSTSDPRVGSNEDTMGGWITRAKRAEARLAALDAVPAPLYQNCPDAEVCKTCPCADEDDVCFPGERLRADLEEARAAIAAGAGTASDPEWVPAENVRYEANTKPRRKAYEEAYEAAMRSGAPDQADLDRVVGWVLALDAHSPSDFDAPPNEVAAAAGRLRSGAPPDDGVEALAEARGFTDEQVEAVVALFERLPKVVHVASLTTGANPESAETRRRLAEQIGRVVAGQEQVGAPLDLSLWMKGRSERVDQMREAMDGSVDDDGRAVCAEVVATNWLRAFLAGALPEDGS